MPNGQQGQRPRDLQMSRGTQPCKTSQESLRNPRSSEGIPLGLRSPSIPPRVGSGLFLYESAFWAGWLSLVHILDSSRLLQSASVQQDWRSSWRWGQEENFCLGHTWLQPLPGDCFGVHGNMRIIIPGTDLTEERD